MPDAVRKRIKDAVLDQLQTLTLVDADNVEIARDGEPLTWPALSIEDKGDERIGATAFSLRYRMTLEVLGEVQGNGGADADARTDAIIAEVQTVLMANQQWDGLASLTDLGNLARDVVMGDDVRTVCFGQTLLINYAVSTTDPTSPSD